MTICSRYILVKGNLIKTIYQLAQPCLRRHQSTNSAIRKGLSKNPKGDRGRKSVGRGAGSGSVVRKIEPKREREGRRVEDSTSPGFSALRRESERQERAGKSRKEARAAGFSRVRRGNDNQDRGARRFNLDKPIKSPSSSNRVSRRDEIPSERRKRERNSPQHDRGQYARGGNREVQRKKEEPQTTASVLRRSLKDLEEDLDNLEDDEGEAPKYSESATKSRWPPTQSSESSEPLQSFFPRSIPYTTAASQFLYGTSSVKAALRANRRKFYKLYILSTSEKHKSEKTKIEKMASSNGAVVKRVDETWVPLLDKISNSRPHNVRSISKYSAQKKLR